MARLGLALLASLLLAVAAVSGLRAWLEGSETLRANLEGAVAAQWGAELDTGPVEVGFWPARLGLRAPVVALPGGGSLELAEVTVAVAPRSLLRRRPRLLRAEGRGPARLRYRGRELSAGVRVELSPGEPPLAWRLLLDAEPDSGGTVSARGGFGPGGAFEGGVELRDLDGAHLAAFLATAGSDPTETAGRYSGRLEPADESGGPATLRLASEAARLQLPSVRLEGPVALVVQLPASPGPPGGQLRIDASRARVDYAGGPVRASGRGVSVRARVLREPDGRYRFEDVSLKIEDFRGRAEAGREGG